MSRPPVDSKPSIATARNTGWMLAGIVLMGIVALRLTVDSLADISRLGALDPSRAMDELVMLVRWVAGLGLFVMTCGGLCAFCAVYGLPATRETTRMQPAGGRTGLLQLALFCSAWAVQDS